MKKLILTLGILVCSNIDAQNVVFDWAYQIGGANSDVGACVATDGYGNVYTVGQFQGTVDFDPGIGTAYLTANGFAGSNYNCFISKIDSLGNLIWVKQFTGATSKDDSKGKFISIDKNNNLLISGDFTGTIDFDPGIGSYNLTSKGITDAFICKFSTSGSLIWANPYGGINSSFQNLKMLADVNGNILISAGFTGTIDFDPGAGTNNITSQGSIDVAITKLNTNGVLQWVRTIGGSNSDYGVSLINDSVGNVFCLGAFSGSVDFDPGTGVFNMTTSTSNIEDIFICKLTSNGIYQWAKQIGGGTAHIGSHIIIDNIGNLYCTGAFQGTVDFDPGLGAVNLSSNGQIDVFVMKLNNTGSLIWAKQIGGLGGESAKSLSIDLAGDLYINGYFDNRLDFDPSNGVFELSALGNIDMFLFKLSKNGIFQWAKQCGGSAPATQVVSNSLTIDKRNNLYMIGVFYKKVDFNIGQGVYELDNQLGSSDMFLLKLKSCKPDYKIDSVVACGTFKWTDGKTYTSSNNNATQTLMNKNGCDSTVKLNLTLQFPNETLLPKICAVSIDSASSKNIVVWEKQGLNRATKYNVYRENTSSQFVKIGTVHRDSFSTFIDTGSYPLKQSYRYKLTIRDSCGNETLLDSSITHKTVHLTSNVGVGGEVNLIWNLYEGKSYTSHNIMRSANGGAFVKIAQVASNISAFSDLTPPSGSLIYKISLSSNVCRPSRSTNGLIQSNPVYIRPSAVNGIENLSFSMYPNPASSVIEIQSQNNFSKVEILDMEGRLVKELMLDSNRYKVDVSGLCVGVYFVKVTYMGLGTLVKKILID
jgi:hypothetical protein